MIHKLLALVPTSPSDIFGKFDNPAPIGNNPMGDAGNLIGALLGLVFVVAGLTALVYGLWGAINWITSGGDKEKLGKAQARIRNAILGIFVLIIVLSAFVTIFQVVLGGNIISYKDGSLQFCIPTLAGGNTCNNNTAPGGGGACGPGCAPRTAGGGCTC